MGVSRPGLPFFASTHLPLLLVYLPRSAHIGTRPHCKSPSPRSTPHTGETHTHSHSHTHTHPLGRIPPFLLLLPGTRTRPLHTGTHPFLSTPTPSASSLRRRRRPRPAQLPLKNQAPLTRIIISLTHHSPLYSHVPRRRSPLLTSTAAHQSLCGPPIIFKLTQSTQHHTATATATAKCLDESPFLFSLRRLLVLVYTY